jgi:hypothetical protein
MENPPTSQGLFMYTGISSLFSTQGDVVTPPIVTVTVQRCANEFPENPKTNNDIIKTEIFCIAGLSPIIFGKNNQI